MYLLVGPWFIARFLSDAPLGLYFPHKVLLKPHKDGPWRWIDTADTYIVVVMHMLGTVLPMTLWVAWVLSSW